MTLDLARIDRAAHALAAAWNMKTQIDDLPEADRPTSIDEAYAIQERMVAALPDVVSGWKIGAASQTALQKYGFKEPFIARILGTRVFASPATVKAADYGMRGIETEFAFRITTDDLRAVFAPFTRERVIAAAGELIPAIELIDTRLKAWPKVSPFSFIADNGIHGSFVIGKPVRDWDKTDLGRQTAAVSVNGKEVNKGSGADVLGDPVNALVWLANALPRMGKELREGDLVTTGTAAGVAWANAGDEAVSRLGEFGTVAVRFV
ncbi:MAG: hypothetical protein FJX61_05280 [Alphaproteobacteria bacterium]|nr:hypothetical protein [Alphaproteobacteria bacterium]